MKLPVHVFILLCCSAYGLVACLLSLFWPFDPGSFAVITILGARLIGNFIGKLAFYLFHDHDS